jgi:hypothetical protein
MAATTIYNDYLAKTSHKEIDNELLVTLIKELFSHIPENFVEIIMQHWDPERNQYFYKINVDRMVTIEDKHLYGEIMACFLKYFITQTCEPFGWSINYWCSSFVIKFTPSKYERQKKSLEWLEKMKTTLIMKQISDK